MYLLVFWGWIPRSGSIGSYDFSGLLFEEVSITFFIKGGPVYTPPAVNRRFLYPKLPFTSLVSRPRKGPFSLVWDISSSSLIFLIVGDALQHFLSLVAICMSSLENCLFSSDGVVCSDGAVCFVNIGLHACIIHLNISPWPGIGVRLLGEVWFCPHVP